MRILSSPAGAHLPEARHIPARSRRRGFVIGELLIALLLLAVAVSSLAALMYSVSHRAAARADSECVASAAALGKCVPEKTPAVTNGSKLLRSGCATRSVFDQRGCKDTLVTVDSTGETIVKARTDSTAMALLAKKQKAQRESARGDRGFVR
jgi:type II secretory pathway pseudopilin PulG